MVKLSDIIKEDAETKALDKPGLLSEVSKTKNSRGSLPEIKKIYDEIILITKAIMNGIKEGKTIEGKEIVDLAEIIVYRLQAHDNAMLYFINLYTFYLEKEDYLYVHSVNTTILATRIALALGFEERELVDLSVASLLHDIGMLKISPEIIHKTSKLSEEELYELRRHPIYGAEILKDIEDLPKSTSEVVYQHHEREDGSGYPDGKKADEISEYAKILAIADVYEAATHLRPYRKDKTIPYDGVKMIVREAKSSFNAQFVKVFLKFITPYPLGSYVLLNSNEIGRVVKVDINHPLSPVVEIFFNSKGQPPEKPVRIDLAQSPAVCIEKAIDEDKL